MKYLFFIGVFLSVQSTKAKSNVYTLQQCIEYAVQHNISMQQSMLNTQLAQLQTQQNKFNQYPTLNADFNNGFSFGRSVDPTSNQFITQGYYFNGVNLGTSALLFGWFQKNTKYNKANWTMRPPKNNTNNCKMTLD